MFSRKLFKITGPTRAFLYKKILTYQGCNSTTRLCIQPLSRSLASKTLPLASNRTFENNQRKSYGSKKIKEKVSTHGENKPKISETKPVNEEEILEKFIANLSADIHTKHRVYKNDLLKAIGKVKEYNFSTKKQGLLLLRCCTELLPDEPIASRMMLAEEVWNTIKPHTKFGVEHYNEFIRVYIANKRSVMAAVFIQSMAPVKPDITTYELLLKALAEAGDLNQATELIANMKALHIPATESIFNSLILCQGKAGKPQNIQDILSMMTSLKMERSADTYVAIAKSLAWNNQVEALLEQMGEAYGRGIKFNEHHIMEIVLCIAENGLPHVVPNVLRFLPEEILQSPSISPYMQAVATQLVFQNYAMEALAIYNALPLPAFGPKDDQGLHGRSLVRDCVKASLPSSVIGLITQDLMASGRNPIALQNAAEAALQIGKVPLALDMFLRMKQLGMPLRCHYFWPILLQASKSYGEKGITNTIQTMVQMEVIPDHETMMTYVLPYMSFTSPQNLVKKLLETGLISNVVLTPMMETLLNTGQVRAASDISELFQGKIDAEKLIKPLIKGLQISMDLKYTANILEDIYRRPMDKQKDWVGRYLCQMLNQKRENDEINDFLSLLRELRKHNVKISTSAVDYCLSHIPDKLSKAKLDEIRNILIVLTDERLIDEGEMFTSSMPHPKHMNEESLRAHLCELEAKGMNTRGVLRKLLQEYCRTSNLPAAREIVDKCHKEGVVLSAGMKAAIFDLHVKMGELDYAELALSELNKTAPNFILDEYKVIDFATLMVYRKRIDKAFALINEQSKKRKVLGGRNISMNCWRLLDAVAANNSHVDTRNMFELLTSLGYCQPSNVILGPLIRAHLKVDNIVEAVNEFSRIANKYQKTPLKHEILCTILESMSDGISEENFLTNERCNGKLNKLAQTVLSINKKIHGAGDVQLSLIAALADVGYKKTLRKMFLDPAVKFHPDALLRHCERFAEAKKVHALETVAECVQDLRHVDVADIYDLILDVYQRNDDVKQALELWTKMQEQNVTPSDKFVRTLCSMAKSNNKPIPPEIVALAGKQKEEKVVN